MPYPNDASVLRAIYEEHANGIITRDEMNRAARMHGERMQRAAMEAAMEAMRDSPELPCCERCGCTVEDGIEIDGNHYCDEGCAHEDGWEACQWCGEWHDEFDRVEFGDGRDEWHCLAGRGHGRAVGAARGGGRMTVGVWKMTEEGEFVLQEPYATMLKEARLAATEGWRDSLIGYLDERCPYTRDELNEELMRRVEEDMTPAEILEEFVLEALEGDL